LHGSSSMTQRELLNLHDCLRAEKLAIKKFGMLSAQSRDPEVTEICTHLANRHQQHYSTLLKHLQSSENTGIH